MFACQPIYHGGTYLSHHLSANDYYEEGCRVSGRWLGAGAQRLGLSGATIEAGDHAFESLRRNCDPRNGRRLTARNREERISFYDFECSAPKSVSILAVTFGDERLRVAHEAAVALALAELERFAGRRSSSGVVWEPSETKVTGNLAVAAFTHDASRELDAQLHTHCVSANATCDQDGKWFALDNRNMFRAVEMAGRIYQNELARRCRWLGYEVREARNHEGEIKGFELAGVTDDDIELQSTRRKQIEAEISAFVARCGRQPTARERHEMATATRGRKLIEISTEEVLARQRAKYDGASRTRLSGLVAGARARGEAIAAEMLDGPAMVPATEAAAFAASHLFERSGIVSASKLTACALANFAGRLDLCELREALRISGSLVRLRNGKSQVQSDFDPITTRENLEAERALMEQVSKGKSCCPPLGRHDGLPPGLKPDQTTALQMLLDSRDVIVALRGPAGAGKTFVLRALADALKRGGTDTVFVAPTHKAKQELQKGGFETAETIPMFLADLGSGRVSVRGKVLVVDESGMTSTRAALELVTAATAAGARVVLVGDEKQLRSVEPGDTLRLLKEYSPLTFAELTQIRRQQENPEYLRAAQAMSEGRVRDGLEILSANGWIVEGGGDYLKNAAKDYLRRAGDKIMVAPTWREVAALNAAVRQAMIAGGRLGQTSVLRRCVTIARNLTAAQRRMGRSYSVGMVLSISHGRGTQGLKRGEWAAVVRVDGDSVILANGAAIDLRRFGARLLVGQVHDVELRSGDRILLQQNDRQRGLTNGTIATVRSIADSEITIELPSGKSLVLPDSYRLLTHGYAVTTEASQGATCETAIFAAGSADDVRRYVALTRGKRSVSMHVPDRGALMRSARNTIPGRPLAMDHLGVGRPTNGASGATPMAARHGVRLPRSMFEARPLVLAAVAAIMRRLLVARHAVLRVMTRSHAAAAFCPLATKPHQSIRRR